MTSWFSYMNQISCFEVQSRSPHQIHRAEDVAVVVAGLQVFSDVSKRAQVLRVLGCTGYVADLVLCNDVLHGETQEVSWRKLWRSLFYCKRIQFASKQQFRNFSLNYIYQVQFKAKKHFFYSILL